MQNMSSMYLHIWKHYSEKGAGGGCDGSHINSHEYSCGKEVRPTTVVADSPFPENLEDQDQSKLTRRIDCTVTTDQLMRINFRE